MASWEKEVRRPSWLKPGTLRWACAQWEPLSFLKRLGGMSPGYQVPNAPWTADHFYRVHTAEVIAKLAEAGIDLLTTHFFKGWGLQAEAEEIEWTKRLIEECHKCEIKVFVYVQMASLFAETFFAEVPDAHAWIYRNRDGTIGTYPNQYWRFTPSLSHPGFIKYIETVIKKAIEEVDADGIWLDNYGVYRCYCDLCQERFRDYLREAYPSAEAAKDRFGFSSFDHVFIPTLDTPDALNIAWANYGMQLVRDIAWELRSLAKQLNPEIGFAVNSGIHWVKSPLTGPILPHRGWTSWSWPIRCV